jgi:hypothetical protein
MENIRAIEEFCLLGYNAMQSSESQLISWRNVLPPSWGSKSKPSKKQHEAGSKQAVWL